MRAPRFWADSPAHPAARLLKPLGYVYGAVTAARMDRPGAAVPCPVICVGNVTLGGAGKTPTALRVVGMLRALGASPAFLSRGYGGRSSGPLLVDPQRHAAAQVGDEPLLLSRQAPTVVARDRLAGARLCAELGATVVVMDDGLQNPSLAKDLTLAVIDAGFGVGNGLVFPAGPLRAPLDRQWRHVDGVVLIGEGPAGEETVAAVTGRLPVYRAALTRRPRPDLAGRPVYAFAGIGRPEKFFETVRASGARLVGRRAFPDHHLFRAGELSALATEADRREATLVTTAKDFLRLPPAFAGRVEVLEVSLRFLDEAPLRERLRLLLPSRHPA